VFEGFGGVSVGEYHFEGRNEPLMQSVQDLDLAIILIK